MGARADFYVGRGEQAEWLGSIAWDGYPTESKADILTATTVDAYREAVKQFIAGREDGTTPDMGWPWPWEDSKTTDYAYAFDEGKVWASGFGNAWFDAKEKEPRGEEDAPYVHAKDRPTTFPNMKARAKPTLGARSGLIVVRG